MTAITVLDTTLRDGSYAVNFTFSAADTKLIAQALEGAGVRYIEIGHGVGLNASRTGHGDAAASDEEYLDAAASVLTTAKYGMFCIPGVATLADVDLAARYRMDFIRIGTNVTEVEQSEPFIQRAKEHGMLVAANYMKSYALAPAEFAKNAVKSQRYGADVVYIVDSAGGMFPDDVAQYLEAIRQVSDVTLGFHGHDNLGLAVANSLQAAVHGAAFVDSSLQGLGRSAGNASTELLVAALHKRGSDTGIDLFALLDAGQEFVRPLVSRRGVTPLDVIAGFADFHSSYMHHIQRYSTKYEVHPLTLIIELCKVDKVNADEAVLDGIARNLQHTHAHLGKFQFHRYFGHEQD